MSIYRRDDASPEWEPMPWDLAGEAADEQEAGFHRRAITPISWQPVPYQSFPKEGVFGHRKDWFAEHEVEFYASLDGEDLLLIRNPWHGFPDPPEWGLASRPSGRNDLRWVGWGHFPELPNAWALPSERSDSA